MTKRAKQRRKIELLLNEIELWLREIIREEVSALLTRNMTPEEWAKDRSRHKGGS